ncbi:hypothetical protein MLD38_036996 [Melastoma candidum]|uniref:Uncharacterized protein n=1 Tax=Melastoma candidum TaxID=119954 RepID=A0ACB9LM33_9MYRT|nr:hypothetical protein MLD38_036996 [Melastoma candidum]
MYAGTNVASNKLAVIMVQSFMPASLQEIWNTSNVRGFMMLSLFLQVLLASTAHLRKASTSRFFRFVIWSAYFMADWVATFTFGLISNAQRIDSISPPEVNENLMAFWAAFLLIHLGGPDTITAFSLEDNALWMRHLVGLVAQFSTFFYIFFKTLPDNNLIAPTILIAFAGAIKYGERTRSLYLASMENLKKSTGKLPVTSFEDLEGVAFPDENTGKEAYYFFQIFKGLVVEINPNHAERAQSLQLFQQKDAKEAFDLMEAELNLLFELFYTKISSINSSLGVIVRIITLYSVIAALILYSLLEKKGFHEVDIWITYFFLGGTVTLEMTNGMMIIFSNWRGPERWFHHCWTLLQLLCFAIPLFIILVGGLALSVLCGCFDLVTESWSKKLGAFSLLSHCIEHCHRGGNKPLKYAHLIYRTVTRRKKEGILPQVADHVTAISDHEIQPSKSSGPVPASSSGAVEIVCSSLASLLRPPYPAKHAGTHMCVHQ